MISYIKCKICTTFANQLRLFSQSSVSKVFKYMVYSFMRCILTSRDDMKKQLFFVLICFSAYF
eukprot:UN27898